MRKFSEKGEKLGQVRLHAGAHGGQRLGPVNISSVLSLEAIHKHLDQQCGPGKPFTKNPARYSDFIQPSRLVKIRPLLYRA
jgi:hypothetical protein